MKKLILLALILASVAVSFLHFGPSFVEKKAEEKLSQALKTPVKIIGTEFDIKNKTLKFKTIAIKNYPAIKIKNTLFLNNIEIKVLFSSLLEDEILVEKFSFEKAKIKFSETLPFKTKLVKFKGITLEDIILRKDHLAEDLAKEVGIILSQEIAETMPLEHKAFEEAVKAAREGKNLFESGKAYVNSKEFKDDVKKGKKAASKFFNKLGDKLDNLNDNIDKHYEMHEGKAQNSEGATK